jgi:hypothetical protein
MTLRVCRDHGWPIREIGVAGSATSVWVQETVAVRLLLRLAHDLAVPDAVIVGTADLSPAQIRGLREALPAGTSLGIVGRLGLPDWP